MILTLCTACAAPLPEDGVVQCPACATRYCSERCERYDRRRGGHGKICGAIESSGGAEQHHANKKYEEAAAEAVEECAEDTEGQTCYVCLEDGSEEGLVRMCACRGASGIAHLSCLARQAKILVQEAEERNLNTAAFNTRWRLWDTCRLCKQDYHGVVACALGWACWKTYLGRPQRDSNRQLAMSVPYRLGGKIARATQPEPVRRREKTFRGRPSSPLDQPFGQAQVSVHCGARYCSLVFPGSFCDLGQLDARKESSHGRQYRVGRIHLA